MKVKDILTKIVDNKINGQKNTSIKKRKLKEIDMSVDEFLDMKLDTKTKKILKS